MSDPFQNGASRCCPRCEEEAYTTLFQGSDRLYRTTDLSFYVVECRRCGLIRLDPMPAVSELHKFYPENYWWEADHSASGRLAEIYRQFVISDHVQFAARAIRGSGVVLDIGCGGGSFLAALKKRGARVMGLDISATAVQRAGKQYGVPGVCGSLPATPFAAGSFAAITMFHVLEHLPDPVEILAAAAGMLAPGGRLVVQVPNAACWQMLLLGRRWSGFDVPRHLINFRVEDLEDLLDGCGFEVRRRKYFSLRDNPAGLATSLFPQLEPVSRRVRAVPESSGGRLMKDLLFLALTAASVPFTLLEAAGAAGSTVMVEAGRKGEA